MDILGGLLAAGFEESRTTIYSYIGEEEAERLEILQTTRMIRDMERQQPIWDDWTSICR